MENKDMWKSGRISGGYRYSAKVYDTGSEYGINGGRISKLDIRKDDIIVANYDRGWDIKPTDKADKDVLAIILHIFETGDYTEIQEVNIAR
jgi:hypothetical protein